MTILKTPIWDGLEKRIKNLLRFKNADVADEAYTFHLEWIADNNMIFK